MTDRDMRHGMHTKAGGASIRGEEDERKRLRMAPEERRESILDAAQRLFLARGWDAVTIADVLAEAGISKGGFYHHFTAKEELLDGLVQRMTWQGMSVAQAAQKAADGDALSRFNAFIAATNRWRVHRAPELKFIADVLLRPENDALFHRINAEASRVALPMLQEMIDEGVAEGCFTVTDSQMAAEVILALGPGRRDISQKAIAIAEDGDVDDAIRLLNERMIAEGAMLDRLLGLPIGSVALADPDEFRMMIAEIAGSR
ncbi:TetR/AcrR family transcriptional regulator [Lutimaribacter marinistellae]|uniref:TetR/AcrR family transcriptional regulator n=1 Tax=Lutimaribacter marinistellae TaxID=1820329 RepID=A0ABV7TDQ2_9RHOB